jgi:hypothetical protein
MSLQPEGGGVETRNFRSSVLLHSVDWQLVTDVSGQPIGPIFEGQAGHKKFWESSLRNIPEERGSLWHRSGRLKTRRSKPALQKDSTSLVFGEFVTQVAELGLLVSPSLPVRMCIIKKENSWTVFCEMWNSTLYQNTFQFWLKFENSNWIHASFWAHVERTPKVCLFVGEETLWTEVKKNNKTYIFEMIYPDV